MTTSIKPLTDLRSWRVGRGPTPTSRLNRSPILRSIRLTFITLRSKNWRNRIVRRREAILRSTCLIWWQEAASLSSSINSNNNSSNRCQVAKTWPSIRHLKWANNRICSSSSHRHSNRTPTLFPSYKRLWAICSSLRTRTIKTWTTQCRTSTGQIRCKEWTQEWEWGWIQWTRWTQLPIWAICLEWPVVWVWEAEWAWEVEWVWEEAWAEAWEEEEEACSITSLNHSRPMLLP